MPTCCKQIAPVISFQANFHISLSGLSPFGGETDEETLRNVKSCDWAFDDEAFRNISQDGKDFIKKLLVREPT